MREQHAAALILAFWAGPAVSIHEMYSARPFLYAEADALSEHRRRKTLTSRVHTASFRLSRLALIHSYAFAVQSLT